MRGPIVEEANTNSTGEETDSLDGKEIGDAKSAAIRISTPITSDEVAHQIRAATDPLTGQ